MASPPAWAEEARQAADERLTSLPALTGREEAWRFTPPAELALLGPEPADTGPPSAHLIPSSQNRPRKR